MPRILLAFNGDLESRLALNWLVQERGYQVLALSINLGQGVSLNPLAELALELGAVSAQVIDRREEFLRDFAFPVIQSGAVYQSGCFLGSALARYVVAQEMVHMAREEGCQTVAHSAAGRGNDQVRMEMAIAAQAPDLRVLAPVRQWHLKTLEDKLGYARRRHLPIEEPREKSVTIDRNLWGTSIFQDDLRDSWEEARPEVFCLTRPPEQTPDQPAIITIGFQQGIPCSLNGQPVSPLPLVGELNRLGGEHGIGRRDVVEDRLFGIKSREFYEAPTPTLLFAAHRDLETLVQSRDLLLQKELLSQRYADLIYKGLWFSDLRRSLQEFFLHTQKFVTGEVRLKLFKGACHVVGRRSPHSLYDGRLVSQSNLDWFDDQWFQGFTSLLTLPARLAARQQRDSAAPDG